MVWPCRNCAEPTHRPLLYTPGNNNTPTRRRRAQAIATLTAEARTEWEQLFFVSDSQVSPLVCAHPATGAPTLCFHCGEPFVRSFVKVKVVHSAGGSWLCGLASRSRWCAA